MAGSGGFRAGCGCKGIRSCLQCEAPDGRQRVCQQPVPQKTKSFKYNPAEGVAIGEPNTDTAGWMFPFQGVCLIPNFVMVDEEREMVHLMDQEEWRQSQSGRRKQDYGPKVNFKKQKLKIGNFTGLPSFSQVLWQRMKQHKALEGFMPVEQCNLDYNSDRGSGIDPHFDDSWLWGERLVSLNLLSQTVLTMTNDSADFLQLKPYLSPSTESNGMIDLNLNHNHCGDITQSAFQNYAMDGKLQPKRIQYSDVEVAICLPQRSLVVLYGDARHRWKHAIHREHIDHRRVCSTFRELSAEFRPGGKQEELGQTLLDIALKFQGKVV
ncbi:alpha-ketoglutarate-dependent dioxygenase alkB homolog 4 [Discoglossus pictus]